MHPRAMEDAAEELLRCNPSIGGGLPRIATRDTGLGETTVAEGDLVLAEGANHDDPAVFPGPHEMDLIRRPGPKFALGAAGATAQPPSAPVRTQPSPPRPSWTKCPTRRCRSHRRRSAGARGGASATPNVSPHCGDPAKTPPSRAAPPEARVQPGDPAVRHGTDGDGRGNGSGRRPATPVHPGPTAVSTASPCRDCHPAPDDMGRATTRERR